MEQSYLEPNPLTSDFSLGQCARSVSQLGANGFRPAQPVCSRRKLLDSIPPNSNDGRALKNHRSIRKLKSNQPVTSLGQEADSILIFGWSDGSSTRVRHSNWAELSPTTSS